MAEQNVGRVRKGYEAWNRGDSEGGVKLNHVTISVTDMERAVAFYKNLGLKQTVANCPHYARWGSRSSRIPSINRTCGARQASRTRTTT